MAQIDVDFEVFKELTARRASESVTCNDVIRELLGLKNAAATTPKQNGAWVYRGVQFPDGTQLRATYKGKNIHRGDQRWLFAAERSTSDQPFSGRLSHHEKQCQWMGLLGGQTSRRCLLALHEATSLRLGATAEVNSLGLDPDPAMLPCVRPVCLDYSRLNLGHANFTSCLADSGVGRAVCRQASRVAAPLRVHPKVQKLDYVGVGNRGDTSLSGLRWARSRRRPPDWLSISKSPTFRPGHHHRPQPARRQPPRSPPKARMTPATSESAPDHHSAGGRACVPVGMMTALP